MMAICRICAFQIGSLHWLGNQTSQMPCMLPRSWSEGWLLLIKEWHSERPEPGVKCYCKMPLIRWKICGKLLYKWGTLTFFNIILGIEKASGHAWLQLVSCMLPCWTHVRTLSVLFTSKLASDGYHSAVYLCYCLLFSQGYFVVDVIAYYWACSACMFCHPSSTCVA